MTNSATSHLLPVFARVDLGFERGEGAWLIATNGERYLDFTSGVAVNALGHAHPGLARAISEQAQTLIHTSNLFYHPLQGQVAERLATLSGLPRESVPPSVVGKLTNASSALAAPAHAS